MGRDSCDGYHSGEGATKRSCRRLLAGCDADGHSALDERVALRATQIGLKAHAGWMERTAHELTGRDGGPIATQHVTTMTALEKAAAFAKVCW